MLRSMSAALSGLRAHQAMLDVVGNNISNVSTTGFKSSQTVFEDVLSQTLRGSGAPQPEFGGTNPSQVGLGVRLAGTSQSMTQGALQRSGRSNDMGIQGDGFFVTEFGGERFYTRAGNFTIDGVGRLVTQSGQLVQGWQASAAGVIDTNQPLSDITVSVGGQLPPQQTSSITVGGNLPATAVAGDVFTSAVTVYDQEGIAYPLTISYTKDPAANTWVVSASYGSPATPLTFTSTGTTSETMVFGANGELVTPATRDLTFDAASFASPGFPGNVTVSLGAANAPGRVVQFAGNPTVSVTAQNGSTAGVLQSYTVTQDGTLQGYYSNGRNQAIGQVAIAVFANPEGLERVSGDWRETPNSGLAQVGTALTGGRGAINPGTLESSNVDLPQEFTNLIVSQRGFQANSRVITTSDELLQEIVNLKR